MSQYNLWFPDPVMFLGPWGIPVFIPGKGWVESSIPNNLSFWNRLEPEAQERIIKLLKERLQTQHKLLVSSVKDRREDRPVASLQVGASRNLAVCRIARYFPHKDFQIFIENILKIITENQEVAKNFDSIAKLKEIFLIPNEIAGAIYDKVGEALKNSPQDSSSEERSLKCSEILLGGLKDLEEHQLTQLNPIPVGSGFLVGATHLLTNYHVLFDEEVARQCVAQFNYEEPLGVFQKQVDYELDPNALFIQEPNLDYALVQLKFNQLTRQAGHNFGWLQLIEDDGNIIPDISQEQYILSQLEVEGYKLSLEERQGDNVILIHHPKGRQKKIDLTNNRVASGGLYKKFLRYQGESDYGSSGCPVFNTKWELVALNHAAIPQKNGAFVKQGIRTCAIVEDLKRKGAASPKLKSFIEDFVITSEYLSYPPLSSALEFDGVNSYVSTSSFVTFATANFDADTVSLRGMGGIELKAFNGLAKIRQVTFSPSGDTLAISNDRSINIYDLNGVQLVAFEHGHGPSIRCLKFSPDGETLSSCGGRTIKLWKWKQTAQEINGQSLEPVAINDSLQAPWDLCFSANGEILYAVSLEGLLGVWETSSHQFSTKQLAESGGILGEPAFSSDGKSLASTPTVDRAKIQIWSIDGSLVQSLQAQSLVVRLSFSPDREILAAALNSHTVQLWRLSDGEPLSHFDHEGVTRVNFSPDGKILISASSASLDPTARNGIVKLWRLSDGSLLASLKNTGSITAFNPKTIQYFADGSTTTTLDKFTIEAWINPTANRGCGTIVSNFLSSNRSLKLGTYQLYVYKQQESSVGIVLFRLSRQDPENLSLRSELSAPLAFGVFSHFAVVCDGKRNLSLYVNGQKLDEITVEKIDEIFKLPPRFGMGDAPETIGASVYDTLAENNEENERKLDSFFQGAIAEVRFWSKARTQAEIKANMYRRLYGDELKVPDLVGYWRFEEGIGNWVYNLADNTSAEKASAKASGIASNTKWLNTFQAISLSLPAGLKFGTKREYQSFKGHEAGINSVAFSPDGLCIVSGSDDNTIRLWGAQTGQPIGHPLQGHTASIHSVRFSPNGKCIVSSSSDNTIRLWNAQTGQPICLPFRSHDHIVTSVAFSPDGRRIVSSSADQTVRLWDLQTNQEIQILISGISVGEITFSPDGLRIATGCYDHTVRVWDAQTGQEISCLKGHRAPVTSVAFSPDGKRIASGSNDRIVQSWDVQTSKPIFIPALIHEDEVYSVAFSPVPIAIPQGLGYVIASGSKDKTVRLWDAQTGQAIFQPLQGHEGAVESVAFSPDGHCIASGSQDKTIRLWNTQTGQVINLPPHQVKDGSIWVSLDQPIVSNSDVKTELLRDATITPISIDCVTKTNLDTPDAITVEAWVKHLYGNCLIASRLDEMGGYSLGWHDDKIRVNLRNKKSETVVDTKDKLLNDNVWHHIAFTWDNHRTESKPPSQEISIYIDGRLQETVVVKGEHRSITFEEQYKNIGLFQSTLEDLTADFKIAGCEETVKDLGEEEPRHYFSIGIAQVRLWRVARTQSQIRAAMSQRLIENKEGLVGDWRLDATEQQGDEILIRNQIGNHHGQLIGNVSPFPATFNQPAAFTLKDIDGHWAEAFMTMIVNQGLLFDFSDNNNFIYPDKPITREEFVKVITRAFQLEPLKAREQFEPKSGFSDLDNVSKDSFYFAMQRAYQMGFLPKVSDAGFYLDKNFFRDQLIKREVVIFLLIEGLKFNRDINSLLTSYSSPDFADKLETDLSCCSDCNVISNQYRAAIATATQFKLIVSHRYPESKRLEPNRDITRAELVALLYQTLVFLGEAAELNSPYIVDPFDNTSSS